MDDAVKMREAANEDDNQAGRPVFVDTGQAAAADAETKLLLGNNEKGEPEQVQTVTAKAILKEMKVQGLLATPLAANMIMISIMSAITLAFAGRFGTMELAGAALASSIVLMFGRMPLVGLACALDTFASQAFGAGQEDVLSSLFQRTTAFLMVHCILLACVVLSVPTILEKLGEDPELCAMTSRFSRALLPCIFLEAINRPMNRILVAQRITTPQAVIQGVVAAMHLGTNYVLVNVLKGGFTSVAWAMTITSLNLLILMTLYIIVFEKGFCIWGGGLSPEAFKGWRQFARLAYPACFMQCAESWCWGSMTILAGFLADPSKKVAAISICSTIFMTSFFVYMSHGLACSTRIGNSLGAGDGWSARVATYATRLWVPVVWTISAVLFCEPHVRQWLVWQFTSGSDAELERHIFRLLRLMVALNLVDGLQTVMTGAIQGLGRQQVGWRINIVAFYVIAIPMACLFAFAFNWGVEGLYGGLMLGATFQAVSFTIFLARVDWEQEGANALNRVKSITSGSSVVPAEIEI